MRLKDLSISRKIAIGFSVVLLTLATLAAVVFRSLGDINEATNWNTHTYKVLGVSDRMMASMVDQETGVRGFLISGEDKFLEPYRSGQKVFDNSFNELKRLTSDNPTQQQRLDRIRGLADNWKNKIAEVEIRLMTTSGMQEQARAMETSGAGKTSMDGIRANVAEFNEAEEKLLSVRTAATEAASSTARLALLMGSVLSALLAILAGWMLTVGISRPISAMTVAMNALAAGNLKAEIPAQDNKDEIGQMAKAVLVFRDAGIEKVRLEREAEALRVVAEKDRAERDAEEAREAEAAQATIMALGQGLGRLASGDLLCRIDTPFGVNFETLRGDFNAAVDKLKETIQSVVSSTQTIASGTQEISSASGDLSRRTEQNAASLEETAAALDEITATVNKTADGAKQARTIVSTAKTDAERGGVVVRQAVEAMGKIEKSSQQISQIIGVIDEIAFQTNLLALNAGVEAARAGEAGRGFAVVASEVRALAQRSAEAAKEIKGLISASTTEVSEGVKLVAETGAALDRIVVKVTEINTVVVDIASSAQEQATGLQQVNTAVNEMDQVTQQNAAMAEEANAASRSLTEESGLLAKLVGQFRVANKTVDPIRAELQKVAPHMFRAAPKANAKSAGASRKPIQIEHSAVTAGISGAKAERRVAAAGGSNDDWQDF